MPDAANKGTDDLPGAERRERRRALFVSALVFALALAGYLPHLSPYPAYLTDSPRLTTHVMRMIPDGTGYPLYISLGHLFTRIPGVTDAYAMNLFSAVAAALAVAVLCSAGLAITGRAVLSAAGALLFAWSPLFWDNAITTEVYALHTLFVALVCRLGLRALHGGSERVGKTLFFAAGLSMAHHLTSATMAPALLYLLRLQARERRPRLFLAAVGGLVVAAFLYGALLLRALDVTERSLEGEVRFFFENLTGARYQHRMFSKDPTTFWQTSVLALAALARRQFPAAALVGAAALFPFLAWRRARDATFLLLLAAGYLAFALEYDIPDIRHYHLPSFLILALLLVGGAGASLDWLAGRLPGRAVPAAVTALALGLCAHQYATNHDLAADRASSSEVHYLAMRSVLPYLEPRAFVACLDHEKECLLLEYAALFEPPYRDWDIRTESIPTAVPDPMGRLRVQYERRHIAEGRPFYFRGPASALAELEIPFSTIRVELEDPPGGATFIHRAEAAPGGGRKE